MIDFSSVQSRNSGHLFARDGVRDSIALVRNAAAHITNRNELSDWVQGPLNRLIPHEKAILGFGQVGYSAVRIDLAHTVGLADGYFAATGPNTQPTVSPVMSKWLQQRVPLTFIPAHFCRAAHGAWHSTVSRHQIKNGVLDANVEYATGQVSFIKLLNVEQSLESGADLLSQCITPMLADIWRRIDAHAHNARVAPLRRTCLPLLTPAEREVQRWLRENKTNWEIGQILGKSEWTVKNHVANMLAKYGAKNRHALAGMIGLV